MPNKMLIDAAHEEETRVVVVRGNRVEEFDFESANRKQLRGNIYLAKVTRVEPSLQAAFVDYGGNRHGFLAFSEIHPDYYQIPFADRQALLEDDEAEDARAQNSAENGNGHGNGNGRGKRSHEADDSIASDQVASSHGDDDDANGEAQEPAAGESNATDFADAPTAEHGLVSETGGGVEDVSSDEDDNIESVGAEDALEEVPARRQHRRRRSYKIQEVIKRRQIILVQVVKEERGNKGAALTTYLSIAGRYCVLMPNTARGGGISRKITNSSDRRRLKEVSEELQNQLPEGMGVILRTAGASRTKTEVKRDFEYLMRLWENVRDLTLKSTAPALVYEEGNLVKRSIRDLYSKEIDEVLVAGDQAYKDAKSFMRMLMPSHAKFVQPYREKEPIFSRYGVESQLDVMFSPQLTLKSGGYIVINPTEALVSIDVNSGRATREHNIEDTALSTNLEAAEEISRQLRLRDLAGLIVIDFIDMEEKRNQRSVERKLKECLRHDRARIQVGRISHFGLLEMSRQRIRAGVLEGSTVPCPHCVGTGIIRSTESVALHVLRAIEEALLKGRPANITARTNASAALYILNQKREHLRGLEDQFGVTIIIEADDKLISAEPVLERGEPSVRPERQRAEPVKIDIEDDIDDVVEAEDDEDEEDGTAARERSEDGDGDQRRGRRRRRRKRGRGRDERDAGEQSARTDDNGDNAGDEAEQAAGDDSDEDEAGGETAQPATAEGERDTRRRRRGRRGGRGRRERAEQRNKNEGGETDAQPDDKSPSQQMSVDEQPAEAIAPQAAPDEAHDDTDEATTAHGQEPAHDREAASAAPSTPEPADEPVLAAAVAEVEPAGAAADNDAEEPSGPPKRGWWRRRIG